MSDCGHSKLYVTDFANQGAPLGRCLFCERDALQSKLHRCREALDNNLHAKHTNLWVEIREALDND